MRKKIIFAGAIAINTVAFAQVRSNLNVSQNTIPSQTPFLDASSSISWNNSVNIGKGLVFPRTNLVNLSTLVATPNGIGNSYPNRLDGMIVYNIATGKSAIGNIDVIPGFYYYENKSTTLNGGTWKPLGSATTLAGADGKSVLNGTAEPLSTTGTIGDFYINTVTNQIFGPKTASGWGAGTSLVGPQGPRGLTGATGPAGAVGPKGDKGDTGATGPAGPQGPRGLTGATGPAGAVGPKGDKGDTGATGPAGPQGPRGLTGATGPAGAVGPKGDKGDTGATGPAGPQGPRGLTGATGPAGAVGPKGDKGDTGATGPAGPQGPRGLTGATGPAGAVGPKGDKGDTGATGPAGPQGPRGLTGATGPAGAVGPKGDKGDTGATGPAGPQGPRGLTGATGPAGAVGPKGDKGATGPAGPQGPRGLTGATGPAGAIGPKGDTGVVGGVNGITYNSNTKTVGLPAGTSTNQVLKWNGKAWTAQTDANTNIYTNNGTLSANRTVTMNGKTLNFTGGLSTFEANSYYPLTINSTNRLGGGLRIMPNGDNTKRVELSVKENGNFRIWAGADRLSVDRTTGNVGIGTGTPSAKLDVNGTLRISNSSWTSNQTSTLEFSNGSYKSGATSQIIDQMNGAGDGGANLLFSTQSPTPGTNPNLTEPTEKMRITADGNVGIGTASPSAKLDVNGTTRLRNLPNGNPATDKVLLADASGNIKQVASTNFKGPKGDTGATGARGPQGLQGPKGDKGDRGLTGATGPQGIAGPVGPRGATGPKGDTGVVGGVNGITYNSNTKTVGLPAGTSTNQVLKWNGKAWTAQTDANTTYASSTTNTIVGNQIQRAALTGDVTARANSNTTTIAPNAVTSAKIADGTITGADIANATITANKLAPGVIPANTNIYANNGTLSANRTVTMNGKTLKFSGGETTVEANSYFPLKVNSTNDGGGGVAVYPNDWNKRVEFSTTKDGNMRIWMDGDKLGINRSTGDLTSNGNFFFLKGKGNEQIYIGGDGVGNDIQIGSTNRDVSYVTLWNPANGDRISLATKDINAKGHVDITENSYSPLTVNSTNTNGGGIAVHPNDWNKRVEFSTTKDGNMRIWMDGDKVEVNRATGNLTSAGEFLFVKGKGNEQAYIGGDGANNDVQIGSTNRDVNNISLWNSANGTAMNLHTKDINANGQVRVGSLAGGGYRMVVADSNGVLSTASLTGSSVVNAPRNLVIRRDGVCRHEVGGAGRPQPRIHFRITREEAEQIRAFLGERPWEVFRHPVQPVSWVYPIVKLDKDGIMLQSVNPTNRNFYYYFTDTELIMEYDARTSSSDCTKIPNAYEGFVISRAVSYRGKEEAFKSRVYYDEYAFKPEGPLH
ncbi:hypothetical protein PG630_00935 [Riemerella anatipestifer]|nr:hypothetical protein [Riemerella anatipestifer]